MVKLAYLNIHTVYSSEWSHGELPQTSRNRRSSGHGLISLPVTCFVGVWDSGVCTQIFAYILVSP